MKFSKWLEELVNRIYEFSWYQRIFVRNNRNRDYLKQLHPGERPELLVKRYHCRKIRDLVLGLSLSIILIILGFAGYVRKQNMAVVTRQERPGYFEGDKDEVWIARRNDGTKQEIRMTISERLYTREEAQEILNAGMKYVDSCILGKNTDASHIEYPLVLPTEIEGAEITVQWISDRPDVMSSHGEILADYKSEDGAVVQIKGIMQCQQYESIYVRDFHVYPAKREGDDFWYCVRDELEQIEGTTREAEAFAFPKTVNGEEIVFLKKVGNEFWIIGLLSILVLILLYVNKDEKLKQEVKARNDQLLADYPELISKLTVLMQAGLTAGAAFRYMASDYVKYKEKTGQFRYCYEELLIACHEVDNGVPQEQAYERYGKRCGLLPYMRLGGFLAQNLKRGSRYLLLSLNQEAQEAFAERKRRARKYGEEAGTKMLMPMALMLVITILIILYPAFASFHI